LREQTDDVQGRLNAVHGRSFQWLVATCALATGKGWEGAVKGREKAGPNPTKVVQMRKFPQIPHQATRNGVQTAVVC
jgi:hypothetical protein